MAFKYHYTGTETVQLPEHHFVTDPSDPEKVYETENQINHPHFTEITKKESVERVEPKPNESATKKKGK